MKCAICNGATFVIKYVNPETEEEIGRDDPTGVEIAYPCACRLEKDKEITLKNKLINAAIPVTYWNFIYEGYLELSKSLDYIIRQKNNVFLKQYEMYLNDPKIFLNNSKVLWIFGNDSNAGHTVLAVIFVKKLLELNYKVKYIRMNDLLNIFTNFDEKKDKLDDLSKVDIYLLDDAFDNTKCIDPKNYTKIHLYNWLDTALANGKYFICTSNVDIKSLNPTFDNCKNILVRSITQLNILGSLI